MQLVRPQDSQVHMEAWPMLHPTLRSGVGVLPLLPER